jgi:hypothetical protein
LENIGSYLPLISPIGNVLFDPNQAFKSKIIHQAENGFVIDYKAPVLKFQVDSAVAISTLVKLIDLLHLAFHRLVFIKLTELVKMIIESASCHPSMLEKFS